MDGIPRKTFSEHQEVCEAISIISKDVAGFCGAVSENSNTGSCCVKADVPTSGDVSVQCSIVTNEGYENDRNDKRGSKQDNLTGHYAIGGNSFDSDVEYGEREDSTDKTITETLFQTEQLELEHENITVPAVIKIQEGECEHNLSFDLNNLNMQGADVKSHGQEHQKLHISSDGCTEKNESKVNDDVKNGVNEEVFFNIQDPKESDTELKAIEENVSEKPEITVSLEGQSVTVDDEKKIQGVKVNEVIDETDPRTLARREKQINYGKSTVGYKRYIEMVPKAQRSREHPKTPPMHRKLSRRAWDGLIKAWRLRLHEYDPPIIDGKLEASSRSSFSSVSDDIISEGDSVSSENLSLACEGSLIEENENA